VIPTILALAGAAALVAGWLLLRRLGPRFRVGRLLAAAPQVTLADAQALAARGEHRYVRIHGRISSDEEFPDELNRPLVYRRRRLLVADGRGGWTVVGDEREAVPFGVEQRGTYVAVDAAALADGLVVIPRESDGRVGDLPAEFATGLDAHAAGRLLIEQVSAVEHAFVCGVPVAAAATSSGGGPQPGAAMTAGLGRPLILTTLEPAAAMRVLARSARGQVALAALLLAGGLAALLTAALLVLVG
jgi:hypothetical protein